MDKKTFNVVVRTPYEKILEMETRSLRLTTETGQIGLRPTAEGQICAFEAGLAYLRLPDESLTFVGTAGGLLMFDGATATLLTPLAVVGEDEAEIASKLELALTQPSVERELRTMLNRLEGEILQELQQQRSGLEGSRSRRGRD